TRAPDQIDQLPRRVDMEMSAGGGEACAPVRRRRVRHADGRHHLNALPGRLTNLANRRIPGRTWWPSASALGPRMRARGLRRINLMRVRSLALAVAVTTATFASSSAYANDISSTDAFDLQLFHPAVDTKGYITVNASQVL